MGDPSTRRRKGATTPEGRRIKTTIPLDAATHARLAAAASLCGVTKGEWMARCVAEGLKGYVVIRRGAAAGADGAEGAGSDRAEGAR
jgi:hypothetical protein